MLCVGAFWLGMPWSVVVHRHGHVVVVVSVLGVVSLPIAVVPLERRWMSVSRRASRFCSTVPVMVSLGVGFGFAGVPYCVVAVVSGSEGVIAFGSAGVIVFGSVVAVTSGFVGVTAFGSVVAVTSGFVGAVTSEFVGDGIAGCDSALAARLDSIALLVVS